MSNNKKVFIFDIDCTLLNNDSCNNSLENLKIKTGDQFDEKVRDALINYDEDELRKLKKQNEQKYNMFFILNEDVFDNHKLSEEQKLKQKEKEDKLIDFLTNIFKDPNSCFYIVTARGTDNDDIYFENGICDSEYIIINDLYWYFVEKGISGLFQNKIRQMFGIDLKTKKELEKELQHEKKELKKSFPDRNPEFKSTNEIFNLNKNWKTRWLYYYNEVSDDKFNNGRINENCRIPEFMKQIIEIYPNKTREEYEKFLEGGVVKMLQIIDIQQSQDYNWNNMYFFDDAFENYDAYLLFKDHCPEFKKLKFYRGFNNPLHDKQWVFHDERVFQKLGSLFR